MQWLPDLVLFEGDWHRYIEKIYHYFKADFIATKPKYLGKSIALKRHPMTDGKETTFWHMISEGKIESERIPDLRRCERIRWPKPIIEHSDQEKTIKVWENVRKNKNRICIWLESHEYLIVLDNRRDYILFWTAYLITENHSKRKLQKEYERFIKLPKKANADPN
jgi:hypothetical protein